jgi:hypothetical protein
MDEYRAFFPAYLRNIERPQGINFEYQLFFILRFIDSRIGGTIDNPGD